MYRWLLAKTLEWLLAGLRRGETRWVVALLADDVRFRFPGAHSWAADFRGKDQVRLWLERYVRTGLQLHPKEIVVSGPPWKMTVCTWFIDYVRGPGGEDVYRNEGVLIDKVVWGRIQEHVSFEDTQRTARFDEHLRSIGALQG